MPPHIVVCPDTQDQQQQQQPWRSPDPLHTPDIYSSLLDVDHDANHCSPSVSGGTTPVLQASSAFEPLSISQLPRRLTGPISAASPAPSVSSGAATPTPGMSQRRRAPAPGTIDLSFLALRRPSLPVNSTTEVATSSPRRVSLPEHTFASSQSPAIETAPLRPPRDFPTPALLPDIKTPAVGWFASHVIDLSGHGMGRMPLGMKSPLTPGAPPPGAPRVGCTSRDGVGSPSTFSPLPCTPLLSHLPKTGYFAIATPRAPKLGGGHADNGFSPLPMTPSICPAQQPQALAVGRPRMLRSRFSSIETPGTSLGEIQEAVGSDVDVAEDDKREREEKDNGDGEGGEEGVSEGESRKGDGWAQADATRKRVLLEWESKRDTISPRPTTLSLPWPNHSSVAASHVDSNPRTLHEKVFGVAGPLLSPNPVFASSPLASCTVVSQTTGTEQQGAEENGVAIKDEAKEDTPSASPPMLRSSSWNTCSQNTVSPWRRSVGRRSTLMAARSKPSTAVAEAAGDDDDKVDVSGSGLRCGLFAPTAVFLRSPMSGPPTPNVGRHASLLPLLPTTTCTSSLHNGRPAAIDRRGGGKDVELVLDRMGKAGLARSQSFTKTDLPDLPHHGGGNASKQSGHWTPTAWMAAAASSSSSSPALQRSWAECYTPPPLIPLPSPVGGCRTTTTGDDASTRLGGVNPYFPLVA